MNTTNAADKMECSFYFIVKHARKTRRLKEEAERKISKKLLV